MLPVSELSRLLGASTAQTDSAVTFMRGSREFTLPLAGTFTALGESFVPIRTVVEGLGGTIRATAAGIEITL